PLLPYTTLFRSGLASAGYRARCISGIRRSDARDLRCCHHRSGFRVARAVSVRLARVVDLPPLPPFAPTRTTSELISPCAAPQDTNLAAQYYLSFMRRLTFRPYNNHTS